MLKNFSVYLFIVIFLWVVAFNMSCMLVEVIPTFKYEHQELPPSEITLIIKVYSNNIKLILSNLMGLFSFGIIPIVNVIINGAVLGGFVFYALNCEMPISVIIYRTLPHFTEYIALWCSSAFGLLSVIFAIKNKGIDINNNIIYTYFTYFLRMFIICNMFIFVAAVMEVCVAGQG